MYAQLQVSSSPASQPLPSNRHCTPQSLFQPQPQTALFYQRRITTPPQPQPFPPPPPPLTPSPQLHQTPPAHPRVLNPTGPVPNPPDTTPPSCPFPLSPSHTPTPTLHHTLPPPPTHNNPDQPKMPPSCAQPPNWTPAMTAFTQRLLRNGEDVGSVVILLETEWPALVGKVGRRWVDGLRK